MMSDASPHARAIIFDYGSVLHLPTDEEAFKATLKAMAAEHGFEKGGHLWNHIYVSEAWERAKRGQMTEDAFWVDRLGALGIEGAEAVSAFRARLFEHAPGIHPAMRQLVYDLRGRIRLAVLSNTAVRNMARWLADEHGMEGVFEVVVSSADVGLAKPNPAIYQIVLDRLRLPPEATLFVDDLSRNTEAAEALGIPSIVFATPQALRDELMKRGLLDS